MPERKGGYPGGPIPDNPGPQPHPVAFSKPKDGLDELANALYEDLELLEQINASTKTHERPVNAASIDRWIVAARSRIVRANMRKITVPTNPIFDEKKRSEMRAELVKLARGAGIGLLMFDPFGSLHNLDRDMVNQILDQVFGRGAGGRDDHPVLDHFGTDRRKELHDALMDYITAVRSSDA